MKKYIKYIIYLIWAEIGLCIGALATVFVHYRQDVNLEFDLGTILSIVSSALLALYVTRVLAQKDGDERQMKEIVLKRIQEQENFILEKMRRIRRNPNQVFVTKVLTHIRSTVEHNLIILKDNNLLSNECPEVKELRAAIVELWNIFSGDPGGLQFDAATQEFVIDNNAEDLILEKVQSMSTAFFKLQFHINKHHD